MKILLTILISILLSVSGCKESSSEQDSLSEIKGIAGEIISNPEATVEEVNKLRQYEYQIVKFESGSTSEEIHEQLNRLGKNFWDCFAVEKSDNNDLFVFCKRRPETPLRYIPKGLLPH